MLDKGKVPIASWTLTMLVLKILSHKCFISNTHITHLVSSELNHWVAG